jgi:hypothetical protein
MGRMTSHWHGTGEAARLAPGAVENCTFCLLMESGRVLASLREDLIAQGVDPAELLVPVAPDDETGLLPEDQP